MYLVFTVSDHCLYDLIPRAFGNIMASHHLTNGSVSECQSECEEFVSSNGHRCLGFNFNDVTQTCGLMTGENLFLLDKHHRPSPVHRLFIRRCEIQGKYYEHTVYAWWGGGFFLGYLTCYHITIE